MIRFGILGGRLGPVPWQLLCAVGLSVLGAAGLLYVVGYGVVDRSLLTLEEGGLLLTGTVLTSFGWARRRRAAQPVRPT